MDIQKVPVSMGIAGLYASKSTQKPQEAPKEAHQELLKGIEDAKLSKGTKREKQKIDEPNAPLQKPDFSGIPKGNDCRVAHGTTKDGSVGSLKAVESPDSNVENNGELTTGIKVEQSTAITVDPSVSALLGTIPIGAPSIADFANWSLSATTKSKMASEAVGAHALANTTPSGELSTPPPAGFIHPNTLEELTIRTCESLVAASQASTPASLTRTNLAWNPASVQDQIDPKLAILNAGLHEQDQVEPGYWQAYAESQVQDQIDPKSAFLNASPNTQELVDSKLWQQYAESQAFDQADPKVSKSSHGQLAQDSIDSRTIKFIANGADQDVIDPKAWQMNAESQAQDVADPKTAFLNAAQTAQEQVEPGYWQAYAESQALDQESGDVKPKAKMPLGGSADLFHAATDDSAVSLISDTRAPKPSIVDSGIESNEAKIQVAETERASAIKSNQVEAGFESESKDPANFESGLSIESIDRNLGISDSTDELSATRAVVSSEPTSIKGTAPKSIEHEVRIEGRKLAASLLNQVADRLEALAASKPRNGVTVHLKPFDLGHITMTIKASGKSIEADFQVSNEAVRQAIEQTQKHLTSSLEARGFSLANITIAESSSMNAQTSNSDAQSRMAQQQSQSNNPTSRTNHSDASVSHLTADKRMSKSTSMDGVDYWI